MKVRYQASAVGRARLGCLALLLTEESLQAPARLDADLRQALESALGLKDFEGKAGQVQPALTGVARVPRLLLVGLGKADAVNREALRRAAGRAGKELRGMNLAKAGLWVPEGDPGMPAAHLGEVLAEGALLGGYTFQSYKEPPQTKRSELNEIVVLDPRKASSADAVRRGVVRGEAICAARTLGNTPANDLTPTDLARHAAALAKRHELDCKVLERRDMERLGMGLLLGVARGSHQPPKLIQLEYKARGAQRTLAFVGKGVTFDSGGISLKPGAAMDEMKFDMCGAAAVLGALQAIATLKPKVNVLGVIPATENLPGGNAVKPGDILKSFSGKQVEILNTDAEGRLILGDALAWTAKTHKPDAIVDLATLTGACVVALGHYASGAVTNDEAFQQKVVSAGQHSGDVVWPLPNFDEYGEALKGKYGDLQNIAGRDAGAITGGLFLKHFVADTPWVHLDIAGTAWGVKNAGHIPNEGATGVGVALLIDLALAHAA